MNWLKQRIFGLDPADASLERRGIRCDPAVAAGLGEVLASFVGGYQAALRSASVDALVERLQRDFDPAFAGFAYEGASMLLALFDHLTPWDRRRLRRFVEGPAATHGYIVAVGAGFAMARLPWTRTRVAAHAKRYLGDYAALVVDGFGFHEAYFDTPRTVGSRARPGGLAGYAARAFDSGVGRALWFVGGADPDRIGALVASFERSRQADLWAGVGLACSYAGNAHPDPKRYEAVLQALLRHAGAHRCHLELGVVFAAETRRQAGNPAPWTSQACVTLAGLPYPEAAALGRDAWDSARDAFRDRPAADSAFGVHERASSLVLENLQQRQRQPVGEE